MLSVTTEQMCENFEILCDRAFNGETVIVSRPNNENVVVISEKEYNARMKTVRNAAYLDMIDKSMAELEAGGLVPVRLEVVG